VLGLTGKRRRNTGPAIGWILGVSGKRGPWAALWGVCSGFRGAMGSEGGRGILWHGED